MEERNKEKKKRSIDFFLEKISIPRKKKTIEFENWQFARSLFHLFSPLLLPHEIPTSTSDPIVPPDDKSTGWSRPTRPSPRSTARLASDNSRRECCASGCWARICSSSARSPPSRAASSSPLLRKPRSSSSDAWNPWNPRGVGAVPTPSRRSSWFPAPPVSRRRGTSCSTTSNCPRRRTDPPPSPRRDTCSACTGYCRLSIPTGCSRASISDSVGPSSRSAISWATRSNTSWTSIVPTTCSWGSSAVSRDSSSPSDRSFDSPVPCSSPPWGSGPRRSASTWDARLCLSSRPGPSPLSWNRPVDQAALSSPRCSVSSKLLKDREKCI